MIEILPETQGKVLAIKASGKLTDANYRDILLPRLEQIIQEQGNARVLCVMPPHFHGWEMDAMWDDATFGMTHRTDFEKFAVVGAKPWIEWGAKLGARFMKTELQTFSREQL